MMLTRLNVKIIIICIIYNINEKDFFQKQFLCEIFMAIYLF